VNVSTHDKLFAVLLKEPQPIDWEYYRKGIGSKVVDMYKEAFDSKLIILETYFAFLETWVLFVPQYLFLLPLRMFAYFCLRVMILQGMDCL
jgi:hypothetical protein